MAKDTRESLRNMIMYSVYVRNHSEEGNFKGVTKDLDRIKALGTDILWLMPIHPIGEINKKGTLGSPYSIEDYRGINNEYGSLEDFKELIDETHKRGMKIIIDVVYNHTSHNSVLFKEHPEWFYRKENGSTGNKVGDWTDIIDLDYKNKELWDYQIDTLKYWIKVGVDGFRCDVGSMVPIDFWIRARKEVKELKQDAVWLCESVDTDFVKYLRENNVLCHSDCEMYEAFDITYDYDTYRYFDRYLRGDITLEEYLEKKRTQDYIYPNNYVKLRFLENHDNPRAAYLIPEEIDLKNWTAFMFFEKGMPLIFGGQESMDSNLPNLFDRDLVNWKRENNIEEYIKKLVTIKRKEIFAVGRYDILKCKKDGVIEAQYSYKGSNLKGIFNVERRIGEYPINIADGTYKNLVTDKEVQVVNGNIRLSNEPIIIEY
ncbi:MAG: alpha-amylase family glycosyl hydrolase [Bacillota bacterium]|nr:alpha-amylase family glycosyl hydrolase [Bacillota bacterium]